ncbi:MAG: L-sorbosone dehydrogenase [Pirellulaceae bacterium]|nr:MAG: L-sorbosone dehydrogenase [Pirellulaceae bacterium]
MPKNCLAIFTVTIGRASPWLALRWVSCVGMLALALSAGLPLWAQRELAEIPDPDPELERQMLKVADGFEINLFVSDPQIAKPIQMNFDAEGRLWIVSSEVYPQIKPGQIADDKVLVVEDLDGDGHADRTRVFADGLLIPTGVLPGDGGVYVAQSTELLHFQDTDGDGRADRRRVVLAGFGTEDTHHLLHTLRWGHDGALYMNQSIYIHSHVETPYGVRRLNGGGIWRYRPDTGELRVFCRGFVNPWGHHFDRWGQSFATDGAYGEGINYVFPGAVFVAAPGAPRRVSGLNPGSPKHCGLEIISGRHFPDDWQGQMITNDFRAHRVCRFLVEERAAGAGYVSRQLPELITSTHVAFRPVDVKMGPDGALYIADWYNPIIQHGEVDFRDPRRDHVHGRIWRVTAKGRPLVPRPRIMGAPVEQLLELLKAPEEWVRLWAKLELRSRDAEQVRQLLQQWVAGLDPHDPDYAHHRLEALWAFQTINRPEPSLLRELLEDGDGRVRAAAVRVLGDWRHTVPDAITWLERAVGDAHPRVRLEAVRALAEIPSAAAVLMALRVLDQPMDEFLDFALWQAVRDLEPYWLPALQQGRISLQGHTAQWAYALSAAQSPNVASLLWELVQRERLAESQQGELLELLARTGGPEELAGVWRWMLDNPASVERHRHSLIQALIESARIRKTAPARYQERILEWLPPPSGGELSPQTRREITALLELAGVWKVEAARDRCQAWAAQDDDPALARAACLAVAALGGGRSKDFLVGRAARGPHEIRIAAASALVRLDRQAGTDVLVPLLAESPPEIVVEAAAPLLSLRGFPEQLAAALQNVSLPPDTARQLLRRARQEAPGYDPLMAAIEKAGKLEQFRWQWSDQLAEQVVREAMQKGDPVRGEQIFRRPELQCLQCHAIAGAGGQVGPDLASIGASAPPDYLLESLLVPNAKVKENYHAVTVVSEGRVYTGIPVRRDDRLLVLRDAKDQLVTLPVAAIEEEQPGRSLMPDGTVDSLTRQELVDLLRFLSELGKPGPFAAGTESWLRSWLVLQPTPAALQRIRRTSYDVVATDDPAFNWTTAVATVQGNLPLEELPIFEDATFVVQRAGSKTTFVRCVLRCNQAGNVVLLFSDATGLDCWWDGRPIQLTDSRLQIDATEGTHVLTIAIDRKKRTAPLRVACQGSAHVATGTGGR